LTSIESMLASRKARKEKVRNIKLPVMTPEMQRAYAEGLRKMRHRRTSGDGAVQGRPYNITNTRLQDFIECFLALANTENSSRITNSWLMLFMNLLRQAVLQSILEYDDKDADIFPVCFSWESIDNTAVRNFFERLDDESRTLLEKTRIEVLSEARTFWRIIVNF
jgi:hypothetical protein